MPDFSAIPIVNFWILLQVFARVSSLVAIAPVFGATQIPSQVKILLAFALSIVVWPLAYLALKHEGVPASVYAMALSLMGNAVIGIVMGFIVSLAFMSVQMAGSLLDLEVGFTIAQTFNPAIGDLAAPLTQIQYLYSLLLFILANGHYLLISAVGQSFSVLPTSSLKMMSSTSLDFITNLTANTLANGIKIAAPAAAVMVIVDLTFAYLSKAVPQMNIFFVGTPLKALIGMIVLIAVLPMTALLFGQIVVAQPYDLSSALHVMGK